MANAPWLDGDAMGDRCDIYHPTDRDEFCTLPFNWLHKFDGDTAPFVVIPLGSNAIKFLTDPTLRIPCKYMSSLSRSEDDGADGLNVTGSEGSWASSISNPPSPPAMVRELLQRGGDSDSSGDEEGGGDSFVDNEELWSDIQKMCDCIDAGIKGLGGTVLPKVNWNAPKDARWIALNKSLKCESVGEVLLLLKHSMNVEKSIEKLLLIEAQTLILFKWEPVFSPEFEFRCFVANKRLILISQRDSNQAYPSIVHDRDGILFDIHKFFRERIYDKMSLNYYVFDVVRTLNRVFLIDFNVFGLETYPVLTTYQELQKLISDPAQNSGKGEEMGLKETEKYGNPSLRYATEAVLAQANPDLQIPLPVEVATWALGTCSLEDK